MANPRGGGFPDAEDTDQVTLGPAHGPLGSRVHLHHVEPRRGEPTTTLRVRTGRAPGDTRPVGADANALIVLRRLSFDRAGGRKKKWTPHVPLHQWATASRAGQGDAALLQDVLQRRQALIYHWTAPRPPLRLRGRPQRPDNAAQERPPRGHVLRLALTPEWRLVTGLGLQYGVLDSGMALHGTYGWPVIPAATLKGLAAAGARLRQAEDAQVRRLLGDPRAPNPPAQHGPQGRGGVVFLDALPDAQGVKVHSDVITPHQQPYYTDTMPRPNGGEPPDPRPPAEHHAPVPVPFLSVSGPLRVDLLGADPRDLDTVAEWLAAAGEDTGGGGRTSAGYGYFTCAPAKPPKNKKKDGKR